MNKRPRPLKSSYQVKEEQVNFLLEDIERNLEYEKAIEIRDKQLADTKKMLKNAKTSYNSIVKENKQLKEYIASIKQRFNEYQRQQEEQYLLREKEYFQRPQEKYKKVVYKEETDSEPDIEEIQYIPENKPIEKEKEKKQFPS